MKYESMAALPETGTCRLCGQTKPVAEMIVLRSRRDRHVHLRARCKECHNQRERGRRRAWKTSYQRAWRKRHADLNRSYWQARDKSEQAARSLAFRHGHIEAARIQERMRTRGYHLDWRSARELLQQYGPAYPLACGLNEVGQREVERLRSTARRRGEARRRRDIVMEVWENEDCRLPRHEQPRLMAARQQAILARWSERRTNAVAV